MVRNRFFMLVYVWMACGFIGGMSALATYKKEYPTLAQNAGNVKEHCFVAFVIGPLSGPISMIVELIVSHGFKNGFSHDCSPLKKPQLSFLESDSKTVTIPSTSTVLVTGSGGSNNAFLNCNSTGGVAICQNQDSNSKCVSTGSGVVSCGLVGTTTTNGPVITYSLSSPSQSPWCPSTHEIGSCMTNEPDGSHIYIQHVKGK